MNHPHRKITTHIKILRFRGFPFTITLRQKPKGVPSRQRMLSLCLVIQRCLRGTPLCFCLGVIVNEKSLNLEKTASSVISVIVN